MLITRASVSRPVLTSVVVLIVIALGLISYSRLSIDLMPEISYPTISVITSYSNVGPVEVEELITRPLEESLAAVSGVEEINSTSSEGRSVVRVSMAWGTDLDAATNDIRDRIDRVMGRLPDDVDRPQIRKFDVNAFPIVILGVSSSMSPLELRRFVEDQVKYRFERIPGVASADIRGGRTREIQVNVKASRLRALGVSADALTAAIRNENKNTPVGDITRGNFEVLVRSFGEYRSLDEIRETVVAQRGGNPVKVKDVAEVVDGYEETNRLDTIDGKPSLTIAINKASGSNTVEVAGKVLEEVSRINEDFPRINVRTVIDTSTYISRSIGNIGRALQIGGLLAILILFVFLRNVSSTIIISTAIPVSVIATFALMYSGGLTLNVITFGGLALGIGMLLDNSIVVLENVFRHREEGAGPVPAALEGASEVASAIIASTLTTVVVFLPVIFMQGISGVMFRQMAYVVSFALLCSLAMAVTLIPVLSSKWLHFRPSGHQEREGLLQRIYAISSGHLGLIERLYERLLGIALRHRPTVLLLTAALFAFSVLLVRGIGVELMPATDEGEVRVNVELAVGTKLELTEGAVRAVEEIVRREVPETDIILSEMGGGGFGSSGSNTGSVRIRLVPLSSRTRSSAQVADDLRPKLQGIPGVTTRTQESGGMRFLRMGSDSDRISIEVRGYNLDTARSLARRVQEAVKKVGDITDVRISRAEGSPEQVIRVNRDRAADLGLSVDRIGEALETAVGGAGAGNFRQGGKEYPITVRLAEGERRGLEDLLDLAVLNSRGEMIPLRGVVETRPQEGPTRIERKDQERIVTVNANFSGRDMGSVIADVRKELRGVSVPRDFAVIIAGDYEEQQKAFRELIIAFILAIFLVYMVMAGQFESYRDPFIVLFSIPMALIGVTATMLLTGTVFSVQAFIGVIMLAGIVVNNAIILVDYTNQLQRIHGMGLFEAVKLAGRRRLRPILMTTLTTCLGLLPLSLGLGEGGEAQAPMARVVIGGLASATLVTLVLIPVVYSIFEGLGKKRAAA